MTYLVDNESINAVHLFVRIRDDADQLKKSAALEKICRFVSDRDGGGQIEDFFTIEGDPDIVIGDIEAELKTTIEAVGHLLVIEEGTWKTTRVPKLT